MFLCLFARQLRLDGTSQADLQTELSTVKLPLTFLFLFQSSISNNSFSWYFNRICRVQSGGTNVYEENYKNDNAANHEEHSYSTTSLGQLVSWKKKRNGFPNAVSQIVNKAEKAWDNIKVFSSILMKDMKTHAQNKRDFAVLPTYETLQYCQPFLWLGWDLYV